MGCVSSSPETNHHNLETANPNNDSKNNIGKKMQKTEIDEDHMVKILLLGSEDSGKSTILKQLILAYGTFTPEQLNAFRDTVHMNLLISMGGLIKGMDQLKIPYEFDIPANEDEAKRRIADLPLPPDAPLDHLMEEEEEEDENKTKWKVSENGKTPREPKAVQAPSKRKRAQEGICEKKYNAIAELAEKEYHLYGGTKDSDAEVAEFARFIDSYNHPVFGFSLARAREPETIEWIKALWKDGGIQYCYSRAHEIDLLDTCAYFLRSVDRITARGYIPTNDDICNTRTITKNVQETRLLIGKIGFAVYDAGGQTDERKKWAQYFNSMQCVIFVVAISSYDQVCTENKERNRIVESMSLFNSVCNHPLFKETEIVVFFNKIDIFVEKIKTRPVSMYFPDYKGSCDLFDSSNYFVNRFKALNKRANSKQIITHLTNATDFSATKETLQSIMESIKHSALGDSKIPMN